jgi:anti-sigma regulatory factor (Ser/Thr protein kinase)
LEVVVTRQTDPALFLKMPVQDRFVPLAAAFVGQAAMGLGLDSEVADELALAAEEVVAYLARAGITAQPVAIECAAGSHFVEVRFSLPVRGIDLRAFNLTAEVNAEDEAGLDQMGLLIASRMTDRFHIARPAGGNLVLVLVKERPYPEIKAARQVEKPKALTSFSLQTPDAARIKWFIRLVHACYPAALFPDDFRFPGKVVDMAAAGDYQLLLAEGAGGEPGGGLAWRWSGDKTVELFGPYIFNEATDPQVACELMDACIGRVARTAALALVCRAPTPQLPQGYLEELGPLAGTGRESGTATACFRMMVEDTGAVVWAHPDLTGFLQGEYRRLVFPREIQPAVSDGEAAEPFSVLSVETDRRLGQATLRPIWSGADAAHNLAGHVALLRQEGLNAIFFELDLGYAWQAGFVPGLLDLGFAPRTILPHAGAADLLIFELESAV